MIYTVRHSETTDSEEDRRRWNGCVCTLYISITDYSISVRLNLSLLCENKNVILMYPIRLSKYIIFLFIL